MMLLPTSRHFIHIGCITIACSTPIRLSIRLEGELRAKAISALPAKIARNVESHLGIDRGRFSES